MTFKLTDRRYQEIQADWQARRDPTYRLAEAAMDRFWEPLITTESFTGRWPHVLRFPRPANDIEAAVQQFAFSYTMEQCRRPVLLEYYDEPTTAWTIPGRRPASAPPAANRRASVSCHAAWRETRRALLRRRQLRLVKG